MALYTWSQTAGSNAASDGTINWQEGQAPSSVNDSARAMMAAVARYRDDISGAIATGGTSTAYTVTSYQVFDTLAHMNGVMIAFTPHTTNGATVTLNVDSLGGKPLRTSTGVELLAGMLIAGTPYVATYNNSDAAWYLHNFYGNPYNIPLGGCLPYFGSSAPNSGFVIPIGQAISRATYATLFALTSTTYGIGDGSTTFNLPDLTGRVLAGKEASATRLTSTYFAGDSTALGATGGGESKTLVTGNLPAYTPSGTNATSTSTVSDVIRSPGGLASVVNTGGPQGALANTSGVVGAITVNAQTFTGTAQGGASTPFRTVQPTIICNYIMRVI
jgi:microcystin-dependent protein